MVIIVFRAGAAAVGAGSAWARVRSRRGTWLVCHASCLHEGDGSHGSIAVVIEPATRNEVAPMIIEAYDLTDREQQITRLIARGAATADIAEQLHLSAHTVRDHIRGIFQKVGSPAAASGWRSCSPSTTSRAISRPWSTPARPEKPHSARPPGPPH
jgi:hypothetical protein